MSTIISAFMIFLQRLVPGFDSPSGDRRPDYSPCILKVWRMGRDSNPRYLAVHTLSRRAQSTALAPIQDKLVTFRRVWRSFNLFSGGDAATSHLLRSNCN